MHYSRSFLLDAEQLWGYLCMDMTEIMLLPSY